MSETAAALGSYTQASPSGTNAHATVKITKITFFPNLMVDVRIT